MKIQNPLYILIIILVIIVLLQNKGCKNEKIITKTKIDTVYKYIYIHDTIKGKIVYVKGKTDTVWINSPQNKPDTSYSGLLKQYTELGNKHFAKKQYKTVFKIKDYGSITVLDSICENSLVYSDLISDLKIPEKTVEKITYLNKRQLFIGVSTIGNSNIPVKGVFLGGMYKDKKDHLYGLSVGYTNQVLYSASIYWPIKIK